jgi:hypothetical protein
VGGSARSDGVRSWFQKASDCRAMRCNEREPPRHNCLCSADQQSQMGRGSRKCEPLGASHGATQDSVANVSQLVTVDKDLLAERAGKLPRPKLELLPSGIDVVLGR